MKKIVSILILLTASFAMAQTSSKPVNSGSCIDCSVSLSEFGLKSPICKNGEYLANNACREDMTGKHRLAMDGYNTETCQDRTCQHTTVTAMACYSIVLYDSTMFPTGTGLLQTEGRYLLLSGGTLLSALTGTNIGSDNTIAITPLEQVIQDLAYVKLRLNALDNATRTSGITCSETECITMYSGPRTILTTPTQLNSAEFSCAIQNGILYNCKLKDGANLTKALQVLYDDKFWLIK